MKKIQIAAIALVCFTAISAFAAAKPKDVSNPIVIIDSKGANFGMKNPKWVNSYLKHENQKKMNRALGLKGQKVWVLNAEGKNVEFLKMWVDNVDAASQVAASIQRSVVDYVKSSVTGDEDELNKEIERYTTTFTSLNLAGLEKEDDWWIKTRQLKPCLKHSKDDNDYIVKYQYMVVFSMDENTFKEQIKYALKDIKDSPVNKDGLMERLMEDTIAEASRK